MSRKPVIGITRGRKAPEGMEYYKRAIEEVGGECEELPPFPVEGMDVPYRIDGLLLSGGGDIHPRFYNQDLLNSEEIEEERDEWELWLTREVFKMGKPILGICKGMQVLNVALGGTLYQDIPGHRNTKHLINISEGSLLHRIMGGEKAIEVNSSHHQALKDVPPHLQVIAHSSDGVIEAVEGRHWVLGVQFHPEREPYFPQIFSAFVEASLRIIYTLGTSKRGWEEFLGVIRRYHIQQVIDVRRFPTSQFEWFKRDALEKGLVSEGINYIWMGESLGGYRNPDYVSYTKTEEFLKGLDALEEKAREKRSAIICAEIVPWRCHRRFIASALNQRGWRVIHIIGKDKIWSPQGEEGRS